MQQINRNVQRQSNKQTEEEETEEGRQCSRQSLTCHHSLQLGNTPSSSNLNQYRVHGDSANRPLHIYKRIKPQLAPPPPTI